MKFEIELKSHEVFQRYLRNSNIEVLRKSIVDFKDYDRMPKRWIIERDSRFVLMSINLWEGKKGPWDITWKDICILSEKGECALVSQCGYEGDSVFYKIVYKDGVFETEQEQLKKLIDGAVRFAGMGLDGSTDRSGQLVWGIGAADVFKFLD